MNDVLGVASAILIATSKVYAPATIAVGPPPPPPARPVAETIHGQTTIDPYRWMEAGGPEFDEWARAEGASARFALDAIQGRSELYNEIKGLDRPPPGITDFDARGGTWIYERLRAGGDSRVLVVRAGPNGTEREFDLLAGLPAAEGPWSEVKHARVLSPDGRYLTFGTTRKGEAEPTIRIYDLKTDRLLPNVRWPLWADSSGFRPRWLADSSGFFYVRNPAADATMDDRDRARKGQIFLHRLDSPSKTDQALFGYGITPGIDDADTLYVQGEPDPDWLVVLRRQPQGREFWAADLRQLAAGRRPELKMVYRSEVSGPYYGVRDGWLYTLNAQGAPRYRLVKVDLSRGESSAQDVLRPAEGVLSRIQVSRDAVYVVESLLSKSKLHRIDDSGRTSIDLPAGTVDSLSGGVDGAGAWLEISNWLSPREGWLLEPRRNKLSRIGTDATAAGAFEGKVTELGWATSRDGTLIPYTMVRRTDRPRDGSGYALVSGYGCFGSVNAPFYWPALNAWLDRGGIFVQAGIRGGGELGAQWHEAGRDRNKPSAHEDAIDTVRHLIAQGWTRPKRVGVTGGSCGGMTMGMAALDAPHLIGAAFLSVGAFDQGRMAETTAAGARSVREVGDPKTAEGWRRIQALSPYWQLLPGADRPALLIGNGATDYTIPLWVGGKMVARARALNPAAPPVLWRIDWQAGHSIGTDYALEDADLMAFMFWQLGHPRFQ